MKIDEIKNLGRDTLIKIAEEAINNRYNGFETENFDRIKVMANDETVYVTFIMSIKYVPRNSKYMYGAFYNIIEEFSSIKEISNPLKYNFGNQGFFQPTEESKKAINNVIEILKKNNTIDFNINNQLPEDTEMIIRDGKKYYHIEVISIYWDFSCDINKKTGEIIDIVEGTILPNPSDEDEGFKEIE